MLSVDNPSLPPPRLHLISSPISNFESTSRISQTAGIKQNRTASLEEAMASDGGSHDGTGASSAPAVLPPNSSEMRERLAWLLEMEGETIESYEKAVRESGLRLKSLEDSSITHSGSHSISHSVSHSVSHSPPPPSSSLSPPPPPSAKDSPDQAAPAAPTEVSDSDSIADNMKADTPELNSGSKQDASLLASMAAMTLGEEAPKDMEFCPWKMVFNYPDWWIGKANAPRVSYRSLSLPSSPALGVELKC